MFSKYTIVEKGEGLRTRKRTYRDRTRVSTKDAEEEVDRRKE
jgi:hypothetical protein